MSRPQLIVSVCVVIAGMAAAAAIISVRGENSVQMSEEQRAIREKFFGNGKELPPIEKGQEMRPRW